MDSEGNDEPEIKTARDIPLTDTAVHVLGACVLHTAVFKDVGLVWYVQSGFWGWQ